MGDEGKRLMSSGTHVALKGNSCWQADREFISEQPQPWGLSQKPIKLLRTEGAVLHSGLVVCYVIRSSNTLFSLTHILLCLTYTSKHTHIHTHTLTNNQPMCPASVIQTNSPHPYMTPTITLPPIGWPLHTNWSRKSLPSSPEYSSSPQPLDHTPPEH